MGAFRACQGLTCGRNAGIVPPDCSDSSEMGGRSNKDHVSLHL